MTLSIDNYSSLNENTCGALVNEYGQNMLHINKGGGEGALCDSISRVVYNIERYRGLRIYSQQYITQSQTQQTQLDDRNIAVTFMNYLKIYNQRLLNIVLT